MTKSLPWILAALLAAHPASAQTDQADLVRPLGAADLNSNLARLAANPRDVDAMIGAGEAALALDDPHGAAGFFARADAIQGPPRTSCSSEGENMLTHEGGTTVPKPRRKASHARCICTRSGAGQA